MDFLTNRPQHVMSGRTCSTTVTLKTGVPQGCVLSPFLYSLFTHDCRTVHGSNSIIKFTDDTTVIGLISNNNEAAYREEVQHLATWCMDNNLLLNTSKTKELIVDFRKKRRGTYDPIHPYQQDGRRASLQLQIPGGPHLGGPVLDHQHLQPGKESSSALLLPEDIEEEPSVSSHPGELLPRCD